MSPILSIDVRHIVRCCTNGNDVLLETPLLEVLNLFADAKVVENAMNDIRRCGFTSNLT